MSEEKTVVATLELRVVRQGAEFYVEPGDLKLAQELDRLLRANQTAQCDPEEFAKFVRIVRL